jgi:MinD-like ATPase involved in chromosome partitioning or flagellar assembly
VISIHSFRGGTGKSNTVANLACLIARRGFRVGIIDTDIQSPGVHVLFGLEDHRIQRTLNDYLWGRATIEETAYDVTPLFDDDNRLKKNGEPALFIVPSSIKSEEIARIVREGYDIARLN